MVMQMSKSSEVFRSPLGLSLMRFLEGFKVPVQVEFLKQGHFRILIMSIIYRMFIVHP